MDIAVIGVVFLTSLVITGWTALFMILTPCFLLVTIPLPEFIPIKRFYRHVTRFMCVELLAVKGSPIFSCIIITSNFYCIHYISQWAWMGQVVLLLGA